jgi:YVTN family beta-propeller protein
VRILVVAVAAVAASTATAAVNVGKPPIHPEVQVGGFPTGIALNPVTGTIYVGNGTTGTLSVIDGKRCNAAESRGCSQRVAVATAGVDPIGIAVDRSTNTIYAANASGTVAIVDGRRCSAENRAGCRTAPATVRVGINPQFLAVDETTHTLYVANSGSDTISVIDGRSGRVKGSVSVGPIPFTLAVNPVTHTVYVTDLGAQTVSVVDGAACNAVRVHGCKRRPATVDVGETPGGIALDPRTDTIYVTGETSNDVSVINGKSCNARSTSGCSKRPVRVRAGDGARGIAVNELTHTVYVANTAAGTVSVIDGSACNATVRSGCGRRAAVTAVGISPRRVAVDAVTNTVYVTNAGSNTVTMIDGRTCNGRVHTHC